MAVLVTGAAGFIGSHVVAQLLQSGTQVRATVRNPKNAEFLNSLPIAEGGSLQIVAMDLLDFASVRSAVSDCKDVIHCAASLPVGANDAQKDIVDPSIEGTSNLVKALQQAGIVERIVHTSSVAAIRSTSHENGTIFSVADWCDDATVKSNPYGLAKAGAEKVMRQWVESKIGESKPRLITIHPSIVFGPLLSPRHKEGSMSYLNHFTSGPPFVLKIHINFVDVRDVAKAHINALSNGRDGARYLLHNRGMWMHEIGAELKILKPERKWATRKLPSLLAYLFAIVHPKLSIKQLRANIGVKIGYNVEDVAQELDFVFTDYQQTLADSIDSISQ
jgi:dihydroflavonol-4-reductase